MSERTAVYRLFSVGDTLLYVGIAKRFGSRWEQHARIQPWWPHVDHQTVYWYPSREDARLIEKTAIVDEHPVYNIADSPWVGGVKDDGTGFWVARKPPKPRLERQQGGAGRHRYRAITPRPPDELRERVQVAVAEVGTDVNALVIGLLRFWIGDTEDPPERPAAS